jgi:hypothetical protein
VQGLYRQVVANLAPAVSGVANAWNEWVMSIGAENLGKSLALYMLDGVLAAAKWYDSIQFGIKDLTSLLAKAAKNVSTISAVVQTPFAGADEIGNTLTQGVAELDYAESKVLRFFGIISEEQLKQSKIAVDVARQQTQESRKYFDSLWGWGDKAEAAAQEAGGLTAIIEQSIKDLKQNLLSPFKDPKKQAAELSQEISTAISSKLASLDARSQEGVNFVLAQTTLRRQTVEQQQLAELKKILKATEANTSPGRQALLQYQIP